MTKQSYSSREWLSPTTHSSGYVYAYYNADCPNQECTNLLKFADCDTVWTLYRGTKQIKQMRSDVESILLVLKGLKQKATIRKGLRKFVFKLKEWREKNEFMAAFTIRVFECVPHPTFGQKHGRTLICQHADPSTCDEAEWYSKRSILIRELENFSAFLQQLKP